MDHDSNNLKKKFLLLHFRINFTPLLYIYRYGMTVPPTYTL